MNQKSFTAEFWSRPFLFSQVSPAKQTIQNFQAHLNETFFWGEDLIWSHPQGKGRKISWPIKDNKQLRSWCLIIQNVDRGALTRKPPARVFGKQKIKTDAWLWSQTFEWPSSIAKSNRSKAKLMHSKRLEWIRDGECSARCSNRVWPTDETVSFVSGRKHCEPKKMKSLGDSKLTRTNPPQTGDKHPGHQVHSTGSGCDAFVRQFGIDTNSESQNWRFNGSD